MSFCGKSLIFINYITQWMNCCSDYLFLRIIESKLSSISKNYLISSTPFFDLTHVIMWSSAVPPHIWCDHLLKPPSPLVIQSDLVSIPQWSMQDTWMAHKSNMCLHQTMSCKMTDQNINLFPASDGALANSWHIFVLFCLFVCCCCKNQAIDRCRYHSIEKSTMQGCIR